MTEQSVTDAYMDGGRLPDLNGKSKFEILAEYRAMVERAATPGMPFEMAFDPVWFAHPRAEELGLRYADARNDVASARNVRALQAKLDATEREYQRCKHVVDAGWQGVPELERQRDELSLKINQIRDHHAQLQKLTPARSKLLDEIARIKHARPHAFGETK